jgi:hypothetical protein
LLRDGLGSELVDLVWMWMVVVLDGVDMYQFWLFRFAVREGWDWWFDGLV